MAEDVKVKAKLEFDTNAEKVLKEIQDDFTELEEEVKDAQSGIKDFFVTFSAMAAANMLRPMIDGMMEASTAAFTLANQAYDTQQGIAGMMDAMSGEGGKDWVVARQGAERLHGEMTQLSIDFGQLRSDIEGGHQAVTQFLGGTEEAFDIAGRNMENLTSIANVTGMSVQELGGQFGKMGAGFLSTESPIFNLLRSTGIFADDITKVNQEWQKLTQQERIQRLEGAFQGIAGNLEDAAPTMTDMLTSMQMIGQEFLESFGGTVIREILDEMQELRTTLMDSGETFNEFAVSLGKDFADVLVVAIKELQKGIEYVRENADEIRDAIETGFGFAKNVFEFIVSNKDIIAMALGGGAVVKAAGAANIAGGAANLAQGVAGGGAGMMGTAGRAIPAMMGAVVAGGPAVWALAAGVTALGAASVYVYNEMADEEKRMEAEIKKLMKAEEERMKTLTTLSEDQYKAEYDALDRIRKLTVELGGDVTEAVQAFEALQKPRDDVRAFIKPMEDLMEVFGRFSPDQISQQLDEAAGGGGPGQGRGVLGASDEVGYLFEKAMQANELAAAQAMVDLITGTSNAAANARTAFVEAGDMTVDGMKLMASMIKAESGEAGEVFKASLLGMIQMKGGKSGVPKVNVNFNGNTFKIQQEFRDQDPDRIAFAFEKQVTKTAISRVQASTSAPFGA